MQTSEHGSKDSLELEDLEEQPAVLLDDSSLGGQKSTADAFGWAKEEETGMKFENEQPMQPQTDVTGDFLIR